MPIVKQTKVLSFVSIIADVNIHLSLNGSLYSTDVFVSASITCSSRR